MNESASDRHGVYQRLNELEGGLREHISSCRERRLREEEWHRQTGHEIAEVKTEMKTINRNVGDVRESITEIKSKFAVIVAIVTAVLSTIGTAIVEYIR